VHANLRIYPQARYRIKNTKNDELTQIIILSARLGSMIFIKEIPDFIYRIIVPGILSHGRLKGNLFSFIILSPL
jgi:hypothetical protein